MALRGDRVDEGPFYQYCRALCLIMLDPRFTARKAAEPPARSAVVEALRAARRELESNWDDILGNPDAADIRSWLELNGSPRLR